MLGQEGEKDRERDLGALVGELLDDEMAAKESAVDAVEIEAMDLWELDAARESAYDAVGRD